MSITISQFRSKPGGRFSFSLSPEIFNINPVTIVSGLRFAWEIKTALGTNPFLPPA